MKAKENNSILISACVEDIEVANNFIEELLERNKIEKTIANETEMAFEALLQELLNQEFNHSTTIKLSANKRLGNLSIVVGFEGKMFIPPGEDQLMPEQLLLNALGDKIDYSYISGYNTVRISVARSYRNSLFFCALASLIAVVAYIPIELFVDPDTQMHVLDSYVFPVEQLYTNAVLMIGTPVTFFSLLKNLSNTYIVAERHSSVRTLQVRTLTTSALALVLAFLVSLLVQLILMSAGGLALDLVMLDTGTTFAEIVPALIPSGIFKPFDEISPIPLIVVTLLITYALCSVGKYFDLLKTAVDAGYALFSRMLNIVIAPLPVFCFVALLDIMLYSDLMTAAAVFGLVALMAVSLIVPLAIYAIRLRVRGIEVIPFVKKLLPLLRENFKMGSVISATPYNIRYCAKHYKMNRRQLAQNLPVLAEINLDGNCYLIMLISLIVVFVSGSELSALNLIVLGLLIMFLSVGAPNQPGSILIGVLIVSAFLNCSSDVLTVSIYTEAFLGSLLNLINVTGDIVLVAIMDAEAKAKAQ